MSDAQTIVTCQKCEKELIKIEGKKVDFITMNADISCNDCGEKVVFIVKDGTLISVEKDS